MTAFLNEVPTPESLGAYWTSFVAGDGGTVNYPTDFIGGKTTTAGNSVVNGVEAILVEGILVIAGADSAQGTAFQVTDGAGSNVLAFSSFGIFTGELPVWVPFGTNGIEVGPGVGFRTSGAATAGLFLWRVLRR